MRRFPDCGVNSLVVDELTVQQGRKEGEGEEGVAGEDPRLQENEWNRAPEFERTRAAAAGGCVQSQGWLLAAGRVAVLLAFSIAGPGWAIFRCGRRDGRRSVFTPLTSTPDLESFPDNSPGGEQIVIHADQTASVLETCI